MAGARQWHLRSWLILLLCVSSVVSFLVIGALLFLVRVPQISSETRAGLQVEAAELARRRAAWTPPPAHYARGFGALYLKHVKQANEGCDFDFLEDGAPTPDPEIH